MFNEEVHMTIVIDSNRVTILGKDQEADFYRAIDAVTKLRRGNVIDESTPLEIEGFSITRAAALRHKSGMRSISQTAS